ncbi:hypothetical protein ACH5RR_028480 [Cinchona calisaya]|uniref:Receptor-like serine/threonine-protein kinase n=1 Tax=Cinchona calisaya TaxID=153742 RepID=A0ABD2YSM5_9GENT
MAVLEQRLLYYVTVLAILLLHCSSFLSAQIPQNYSSTANISTTWINHPLPILNSTNLNTATPILIRGLGFACGFYCNWDGKVSSRDCVFGVLIYQNRFSLPDGYSLLFLQFPQLVWSTNRNNLVQPNATLQLTQDGDLVLANSDGTLVWSSNTAGKSVSGMKLTEMGNLVLFGRNNEIIWQSFDHPTDSLLLGQQLAPGQQLTLTASVSATNLSEGLLSLTISHDGLSAYTESNPPQQYFAYSFYDYPAEFRNGSFGGMDIPPASAAQFMRFGPDGHLKVYEWAGSNWLPVADLLATDFGDCGYPMVCGRYGVCSNGQCGCPETTNSQAAFFSQINFRQPNLGCSLVTPISCDHSQYHSLLELNNTYYFAFNSSSYAKKIKAEDCKNMCLSNCSCKAALFSIDPGEKTSKRKGSCLLLNEVFSMTNHENYMGLYYNTTLFVKVQNHYDKPSRHKIVILAYTLGAFFGVFFVIGSCLVIFRHRLKESNEIEGDFLDQVPGMPTRYSYENLKAATEDFSQKLGEGGFGSVYEGALNDGIKIAVKCLDGLGQVKDSFLVEVKTIGSIHHVNLVKLIGFCFEKSHRLLVYEYMANGSLDRWIFGGKQDHSLPWLTRKKIILDIAKGLAYLHEDCSQKIIHLDIKPQNILLDQHFNAKVSDFGLSKLIDKDQSRFVTTMRGTPGYLAPEWLNSEITEKVDVYSFGIVMLEILCGRKNLDWSKNEEDRHLLNVFKRKAEEEKLQDLVDKKNEDMLIHVEEAVEMMGIAAWCLQGNYTKRPSMSLVVKVLEGLVAAETNLDYDFTNSSVVRTFGDQRQEADDVAASLLLPSALSGPR